MEDPILGDCDQCPYIIAQYIDENNVHRPDWLVAEYANLPRVNEHIIEKHTIEINNELPAQLLCWIIENLQGEWDCAHMYSDENRSVFDFALQSDAVLFQLRWRNE